MNLISLLFGIASLVCGLIAAAQWYRASKIVVKPNLFELSDDVQETDFNWELIRAIMMAGTETSTLNKSLRYGPRPPSSRRRNEPSDNANAALEADG